MNGVIPHAPAERLAYFLSENGKINLTLVYQGLSAAGIRLTDPRLEDALKKIQTAQAKSVIIDNDIYIDSAIFVTCISECVDLFVKALTSDLVIPEFKQFCNEIEDIYNLCKANTAGQVADYMPQLSRFTPDCWGVAVCSVDGQRYTVGNVTTPVPLLSVTKPLLYALVLDTLGYSCVRQYVGEEPSGSEKDSIMLNSSNKPHNPMIDTGSLVCASLLKNKERPADRFEYTLNRYRQMAGGEYVGFNNSAFLSKRQTADRNFALGHYLKEHQCFPDGLSLSETMDFYFQLLCMDVSCESASVIAATLANGGICPVTGDKAIEGWAVRDTLSLMHSCGMYHYSGQFAFTVGLPSKSGSAGLILLVIPNLCGMCLWSPPLDEYGNSVRGIQFAEEMVNRFNFHEYDGLRGSDKMDPKVSTTDKLASVVTGLQFAASNGDMTSLRRSLLLERNLDLGDYDGRTALHVASAEGHLECVKFLVETARINPSPKDRFGHTPLRNAREFNKQNVVDYLAQFTEDD